jgi:uncharacterized protein YuzE
MAQIKTRMAIAPFITMENALSCAKKLKLPQRMVSVDYDDEADVLYVKFKHAKIVDNDLLDDKGLIVASLDEHGKVIGSKIIEASSFSQKCCKTL